MLPLEFRSLDFVTVACPYDALACLQVFPALAVDAFLEKNCLGNSPVYACPVRHWIRRPNTSRWVWSSVKCLVGLRDGGILLAIANLPLRGVVGHFIKRNT